MGELEVLGVDNIMLSESMEILTGRALELTDPWGNVLGLTDYVKDPAKGRKSA